MITYSEPKLEWYRNAIATSTDFSPPRDSQSQGYITGCLYRQDRQRIELSQRFGGYHGDFYPTKDPSFLSHIPANAKFIKGKSIYLGSHIPHYGHFLVEMLSTFWCYEIFPEFEHFVFHPFAFGTAVPTYIADALRAFSIDISKVVLIEQPIILENVCIPERLVRFHNSANISVRRVYSRLQELFTKQCAPENMNNDLVYISRVKTCMKGGRAIANEVSLELALRRRGFSIVYPEELSFAAQVQLFSCSDIVCGPSGSGLHNVLFMRPDALLIEIGDSRTPRTPDPMQQICNSISATTSAFIPMQGLVMSRRRLICWMHIRDILGQIDQLLEDHRKTTSAPQVIEGAHNYSPTPGILLAAKSMLRTCKSALGH